LDARKSNIATATETVNRNAKIMEDLGSSTTGGAEPDSLERQFVQEARKYLIDGPPINISLISVRTSDFEKGVSAYDKFRYALARNWVTPPIERVPGSEFWNFRGVPGEILFRANQISRVIKVVLPFLRDPGRICKFRLEFLLNDEITHSTPDLDQYDPTDAVIVLNQTVWFRDMKLVVLATAEGQSVSVPDLRLYDFPVARPN
jgi:hypothetical protein